MDFLNPLLLTALPLAGLAVLIHLLSRRRQEVIEWGAMRFLLEALPRRRRRWRLEELLLMLLRVAAVLALILAMAQPRLRAGWWAGHSARDVVLVLDNSLSTALTAGGETMFDRQVAAAQEFLGRLDEQDRVRVLLAAGPPEWLQREAIPLSGHACEQLEERLRELEPTPGSADIRRCIEQALAAEAVDSAAAREIVVFTDGQVHAWDVESMRGWRQIREELSSGSPTPARVSVHVPARADGGVLNLSVESASVNRDVVGIGAPFSLTAVVRNTGDQQAAAGVVRLEEVEGSGGGGRGPAISRSHRGVDSSLRAGGTVASASIPALAPGETAQVSYNHAFTSPGVYLLAVRLDGEDDLLLDNEARVVVEATDHVPILVVEGTSSTGLLERDAGYLLAALGVEGRDQGAEAGGRAANSERSRASPFRPAVISSFELSPEWIRRHRCIVLLNVALLPPEIIEALRAHVERGGGLWIIPGEGTDRTFFNERLFAGGRGLSPLPLDAAVGNPRTGESLGLSESAEGESRFVAVRPPAANHAATWLLADLDRLDIDQVKIYRRYRFRTPGREELASTLLAAGEGEPLAVEKSVGQGRVIVQAMPLDMSWSNLPVAEAFVVMVHEWLWYLTGPLQTRWNLAPGEVLAAAFPADAVAEMADVRLPDGRQTRLSSTLREDRRVFRYGRTMRPGSYRLEVTPTDVWYRDRRDAGATPHRRDAGATPYRRDAGATPYQRDAGATPAGSQRRTLPFEVRRDAAESDLTQLSAADRRALTAHGGVRFITDSLVEAPPAGAAPPRPAWKPLLVVVIVLMLAELLLAGRLARRRNLGSGVGDQGSGTGDRGSIPTSSPPGPRPPTSHLFAAALASGGREGFRLRTEAKRELV